jgi:hypothetical protein
MVFRNLVCGLAAVCACVSVASATTTKIAAFLPCGYGDTGGPGVANPDVDGTGTLKFNASTGGFTRVHLEISDLQPNASYGIAVSCDIAATFLPFAVRTNPAGHLVVISDQGLPEGIDFTTTHPVVTVFVWDGVSPTPDDPSAVPDDLARAVSVLR